MDNMLLSGLVGKFSGFSVAARKQLEALEKKHGKEAVELAIGQVEDPLFGLFLQEILSQENPEVITVDNSVVAPQQKKMGDYSLSFADLKHKVVEAIKALADNGTREFTKDDIAHWLGVKGHSFKPEHLSQVLCTHIVGIRVVYTRPSCGRGRPQNVYSVEINVSRVRVTCSHSQL